MDTRTMFSVLSLWVLVYINVVTCAIHSMPTRSMEIKMPQSHPEQPETYLCTPVKLDSVNTNYIVGFTPKANASTAHHMLLYGCKTPGQEKPMYNCGAMTARQEGLSTSLHPCGEGKSVIYAWAKNAPELELPEGVGFRVGGVDNEIQWLVLQVHYASVKNIPASGDESGVELHYTNVPQPKSAGVLFLGTSGRIPAQATTNMEAACPISEDKVIHPFAFRVHTHGLGRVVSGWKVQNKNKWTLIGKEDPQLPQMFWPVSDQSNAILRQNDVVAARCTMVNDRNHAVWIGSTRDDEMCNYYMMYWVEGKEILKRKSCFSVGPPLYSWGGWLFGAGLSNIPEDEASSI